MNCEGELECGELYVGNTTDVRLIETTVRGEIVPDATVTVTVRTLPLPGAVVGGADAIAMPADTTPGDYLGVLPSTLALVKGNRYKIIVAATKDGLGVGQWNVERTAKERGRC